VRPNQPRWSWAGRVIKYKFESQPYLFPVEIEKTQLHEVEPSFLELSLRDATQTLSPDYTMLQERPAASSSYRYDSRPWYPCFENSDNEMFLYLFWILLFRFVY
jgi:hypothetical protein